MNLFVFEATSGWNARCDGTLATAAPSFDPFYVSVILAAAGSSALGGALAGAGALFLYEFGIHDRHGGLAWNDFTQAPALTRLAGYAAAGLLTGFLAMRGRRMLAQSFYVLEELIDLAHRRLDDRPAE